MSVPGPGFRWRPVEEEARAQCERVVASLAPGSVAVVMGTRPEMIKLGEILRLLGPAARVVHTGQHFDDTLALRFYGELGLAPPALQLAVGGTSRGQQLGEATRLLDAHFAEDRPVAVVVQGDTNATLAGALAANARDIPLAHVEAGLRSRDRAMPEEHNRVLTDHLADLCCAPTEVNRANLAAEGIQGDGVEVTGNTIVEALARLLPDRGAQDALLADHAVQAGRFVLATFHRPETVDAPGPLTAVLGGLAGLPLPVVLPLHPRTAKRVADFGLGHLADGLHVVPPVGYREFLGLFARCAFAVSDSGGVQEEASVLKRPVLVVRRSTERPEVLGTFAELVPAGPRIGEVAGGWATDVDALHARLAELPSPYGDGAASLRSVAALGRLLARRGPG